MSFSKRIEECRQVNPFCVSDEITSMLARSEKAVPERTFVSPRIVPITDPGSDMSPGPVRRFSQSSELSFRVLRADEAVIPHRLERRCDTAKDKLTLRGVHAWESTLRVSSNREGVEPGKRAELVRPRREYHAAVIGTHSGVEHKGCRSGRLLSERAIIGYRNANGYF